MEIGTERKGQVLVAKILDRFDGVNAREFQDALHVVIEDSDRAILFDPGRLRI